MEQNEQATDSSDGQKLISIYRALHPQVDIDRLYFKRSEGGRGMITIQECVNAERNRLNKYHEGVSGKDADSCTQRRGV